MQLAASNKVSVVSIWFLTNGYIQRNMENIRNKLHNQNLRVLNCMRQASSIEKIRSYRGEHCYSDHYLVGVNIKQKVVLWQEVWLSVIQVEYREFFSNKCLSGRLPSSTKFIIATLRTSVSYTHLDVYKRQNNHYSDKFSQIKQLFVVYYQVRKAIVWYS